MSFFDAIKNDPVKARRLSIILVFVCTIFGAAGQLLMKAGASEHPSDGTLQLVAAIFQNWKLFVGYACYGLNAVMLTFALKFGELSLLYPVIALTYVWVTGLSVLIYHERLTSFKVVGLMLVITGVGIMGKAGKKA